MWPLTRNNKNSPPEQVEYPPEVYDLIAKKQRVCGDQPAMPGTPEAVIEARLNKQIEAAIEKYINDPAENQQV